MANRKTIINDLSGGLNKDFPPHQIAPNQLSVADNIVYRQGEWVKRGGYTKPYDALANPVLEIVDYVRRDGTSKLYAATDDGINELSGTAWTNRLNLGTTRDEINKWWFAEINNIVFATNGVDNIYSATTGAFSAVTWDTTTDAAGETGFSITRANILLALNSRLWFFNTTDSLNGAVPFNVIWTDTLDFDRVEPDNILSLDDNQTPIISAGVLSNNFIAIYKKDMVYVVQNTGNPVASIRFRFPNGILGAKAWTRMPGGHFFVGIDGFYTFSGSQPTPIGDLAVTSHFFDIFEPEAKDNLYCFTDWFNREVHIIVPTNSNTTVAPTRRLIYNWQYNCWSESDLDVWCGFYRFRTVNTPVILYGGVANDVYLQGAEAGGSTDNGTAITTKIRTKALVNLPDPRTFESKDYVQTNIVKTDALPTTTTIKIGDSDFGTEDPTFSSTATITAIDGLAPFADLEPVAGRYVTIEAEGFNTISEFQLEWQDAGED